MKFDDILAFAKAGYKPSEIKELMEMETSTESNTDDVQTPKEETPTLPTEPSKVEEDVIDYKKLYEDTKSQLAQIQKTNIQRDNSSQNIKTDEEILADYVRSFY